ncbi:MAG: hypothetical protein FJ294_00625 [Planctomycetes bacterium]|nr:hypothetical protein [Planctomycetota bacterium]
MARSSSAQRRSKATSPPSSMLPAASSPRASRPRCARPSRSSSACASPPMCPTLSSAAAPRSSRCASPRRSSCAAAEALARDVPLLQERLREHGYRTGAIVGNWVLGDTRSGLARGFDLWCESLPQRGGVPPDLVPERTATSLTDAALVALGLASPPDAEFEPRTALVDGGQPWFLRLHYMDPHGAYQPPERFVAPASGELVSLEPAGSRQRVARHNVPAEAWLDADTFDAARVRARYDGEVRHLDAELGRLLDALRSSGLLDSTVVVLTADHGESLGEQEYFFEHGANAAESTIHMPFLLRAPTFPAGERRTPLSLVDVTPTLLDLLALPPLSAAPSPVRGESVLDALRPGTHARSAALQREGRARGPRRRPAAKSRAPGGLEARAQPRDAHRAHGRARARAAQGGAVRPLRPRWRGLGPLGGEARRSPAGGAAPCARRLRRRRSGPRAARRAPAQRPGAARGRRPAGGARPAGAGLLGLAVGRLEDGGRRASDPHGGDRNSLAPARGKALARPPPLQRPRYRATHARGRKMVTPHGFEP